MVIADPSDLGHEKDIMRKDIEKEGLAISSKLSFEHHPSWGAPCIMYLIHCFIAFNCHYLRCFDAFSSLSRFTHFLEYFWSDLCECITLNHFFSM